MTQSRSEGVRAVGERTPNRYSAPPAGVAAAVAYVGVAEEMPLGPEGADGDGD